MVVILSVQAAHVKSNTGCLSKALETVRDHLRAQSANLLTAEAQIDHGVGSIRQVDDGPREGLVQGSITAAKTSKGSTRTKSLGESGTKSEEGVFGGVVVINFATKEIS